jgi:hypothetical protein
LTAVRRRLAGTRSGLFRRGALSWLALRLTGLLVVVAACAPPVDAQVPATASERSVKAAFVYKFLGYVDWPSDAFAVPDAPLVIGVVAADDLAGDLAEVVRNRSVGTHAIEVRTLRPADPLAGIDVLFVGAAARARLAALARAAAARGILVISESDDALAQGSMINFIVVDGRVRFEVALDSAERAGLKLSSRLLAVAHFVRMGSR